MTKLRRLMRRAGFALSMLVLCSSPFAACYFFERGCWNLQRRLDVCEARLLDQRMAGGIATYKINKICKRLDAFSYSYSPALEAMIGIFLADNAIRKQRFFETAELYATIFPDDPFDVLRAWRYLTREGILKEVKR